MRNHLYNRLLTLPLKSLLTFSPICPSLRRVTHAALPPVIKLSVLVFFFIYPKDRYITKDNPSGFLGDKKKTHEDTKISAVSWTRCNRAQNPTTRHNPPRTNANTYRVNQGRDCLPLLSFRAICMWCNLTLTSIWVSFSHKLLMDYL